MTASTTMTSNFTKNGSGWADNTSGIDLKSSFVMKEESDADGQVVTACVTAAIVLLVLVLCGLLCYREVSRRRKEMGFVEQNIRRESIRRAIRSKIRQLELNDDSNSYVEQMEMKVPLVTFGYVTTISPDSSPPQSPDTLHICRIDMENEDSHQRDNHHYHHHHHQDHHKHQVTYNNNNNNRGRLQQLQTHGMTYKRMQQHHNPVYQSDNSVHHSHHHQHHRRRHSLHQPYLHPHQKRLGLGLSHQPLFKRRLSAPTAHTSSEWLKENNYQQDEEIKHS